MVGDGEEGERGESEEGEERTRRCGKKKRGDGRKAGGGQNEPKRKCVRETDSEKERERERDGDGDTLTIRGILFF